MNQFSCGFLKYILSKSRTEKCFNYNICCNYKYVSTLETKISQLQFVLFVLQLKPSEPLKKFGYSYSDGKILIGEKYPMYATAYTFWFREVYLAPVTYLCHVEGKE